MHACVHISMGMCVYACVYVGMYARVYECVSVCATSIFLLSMKTKSELGSRICYADKITYNNNNSNHNNNTQLSISDH